nr:Chain B, STING CTT, Transmembrane protein 173 [Danio rerio]6MYD_D Chain D, STING CTT, Transmembrane protein 173 [Danio rerio]
EPVETTDY